MKTVKLHVTETLYKNFEEVNRALADPEKGLGFAPGVELLMQMQLAEDDPETMARDFYKNFAKKAMELAKTKSSPRQVLTPTP